MFYLHKFLSLICLLLIVSSCEKFEYSPYETGRLKINETLRTEYNISWLNRMPEKDTLNVVFLGDTQRFYDDLQALVDVVKHQSDVDAVIITGDISDFGLQKEYELINKKLAELNKPVLTVVGNHDLVGKGRELYQQLYGPLNYSFTWNGIRFVFHDTNSREHGFSGKTPDIAWMREALADSANYSGCIFVSHVPPFDGDFDKALENKYSELVKTSKNTLFSSNGHRHSYSLRQHYNDGIWYLNTASPSKRQYAHVTIYPFSKSEKKFDSRLVTF